MQIPAIFIGYDTKEEYTNKEGKLVPRSFTFHFLHADTFEVLTFWQRVFPVWATDLPKVTGTSLPIGVLEIIERESFENTTTKKTTYYNLADFKEVKICKIVPAGTK